MSQLVERFEAAVLTLVAEGPIKQRLTRAFSEHLEGLQEAQLPTPIDSAYRDLQTALHRVSPSGTETLVKASVQKMSAAEAASHAAAIVKIYMGLLCHGQRSEPLKVVETGQRPLPAYLAGSS